MKSTLAILGLLIVAGGRMQLPAESRPGPDLYPAVRLNDLA